jgi:hypothetical protein
MKYKRMLALTRPFYLISFILIPRLIIAQDTARTYTFKEVGMTLTLPPEFKTLDSSKNANINKAGAKMMEESNDINVDYSTAKTLITAIKSPFSYFTSTITPFDPKKDGDYTESSNTIKKVIYKTFSDKTPNAKIDTLTTTTAIDGLQFDKFQVSASMNGKTLFNIFLLSKYYKGYDFGIRYLYVDDSTKKLIDEILNSCKFR